MLKVSIQLDLIGGYGREVLRGLMQYASLVGTWEFLMPQMYSRERAPRAKPEPADGMVAMVHDERAAAALRAGGIPVVNVARTLDLETMRRLRLPSVVPDDQKVGEIAYKYFYERGFRRFAFCGHPTAAWSLAREQQFVACAAADGLPCPVSRMVDVASVDWIKTLDRHVGLLAANDRYAWSAIDACRELGVRVPEDIAVLGVDNDVLVADLVRPALSSIKPAAFLVGIEAGRMLSSLMDGGTPPAAPLLVPPEGVVTRQSTEVLMIDDDAVVSAVRYIRLNAARPISISDVLAEVMISRRNLERRFSSVLGRSILQEIRRVRIDRACELLRDTDFEMPVIAKNCGFASHVRFSTVFNQVMGMSPTTYRKKNRAAT